MQLLVVTFPPGALAAAGFEGRDELEDPLLEALVAAGIGEVVGGGSGAHGSNVDVRICDCESVDTALQFTVGVLRKLNAPAGTVVRDDHGNVCRV